MIGRVAARQSKKRRTNEDEERDDALWLDPRFHYPDEFVEELRDEMERAGFEFRPEPGGWLDQDPLLFEDLLTWLRLEDIAERLAKRGRVTTTMADLMDGGSG